MVVAVSAEIAFQGCTTPSSIDCFVHKDIVVSVEVTTAIAGKFTSTFPNIGTHTLTYLVGFRSSIQCVCNGLESRDRAKRLHALGEVQQELPEGAVESGWVCL